ncbi:MAG: hypothetical protein AAFP88_00640 [Bacteroidota bacterium]
MTIKNTEALGKLYFPKANFLVLKTLTEIPIVGTSTAKSSKEESLVSDFYAKKQA